MSRAIDADVLRDNLQALAYDDWNQGVTTSWADAYSEFADMVEEMPTIEPERKKGKWFWSEGMYSCDQCHAAFYETSPFCPMCGADMRGEQHE